MHRGLSLPQWRERIGRALLQLDFNPRSDDRFFAEITPILVHPDLRVTRSRLSGGTIFRDRELCHSDDHSRALLIANTDTLVQHMGREFQLRRGEATVLENWHPGALSSRHKVDFTALIIPAAHPSWLSVLLDSRLARCIPRDHDALKLLRSYLKLFSGQKPPQLVPEIVDSVTRHITELSFLAMSADGNDCARESSSSIQAARTQAALAFIDGRFSDPNLTPARAAAGLGISVRYLERLLEASGKSFGRRLLERRLEAARRLLSDPAAKALRITDIALQTGFSDLSHFSRRFREKFGANPAELRQANWISLTAQPMPPAE